MKTVAKAAEVLIRARGRPFNKSTIAVLDRLLQATKARDEGLCAVLLRELGFLHDFRVWADAQEWKVDDAG